MTETIRIKNQRASIISSLIIGIISKYAYDLLDLNFYHFYLYFYIVSIIMLFFSRVPWGEMDENGLSIRCGILNNRKIDLNWKIIESISKVTAKQKEPFFTGASSYGMPVATETKKDLINIKLANGIEAAKIYKNLESQRPHILSNRIIVKDLSLKIYSLPSIGIDTFVNIASKYLSPGVLNSGQEHISLKIRSISLYIFSILLAIGAFYSFFWSI